MKKYIVIYLEPELPSFSWQRDSLFLQDERQQNLRYTIQSDAHR